MKFSPDVSTLPKLDFRPYMVECAYDYYMVAKMSKHHRIGIQCVMSALALEISFKSFSVTVAGNHGRLNETYSFNRKNLPKRADSHDLITLFESLPQPIADYLIEASELETLEQNRDLFKSSRYVYEPNANTVHRDDIIKLSAKVICKLVFLYKGQGCSDPFIERFDVDQLFFNDVQRYLIQ